MGGFLGSISKCVFVQCGELALISPLAWQGCRRRLGGAWGRKGSDDRKRAAGGEHVGVQGWMGHVRMREATATGFYLTGNEPGQSGRQTQWRLGDRGGWDRGGGRGRGRDRGRGWAEAGRHPGSVGQVRRNRTKSRSCLKASRPYTSLHPAYIPPLTCHDLLCQAGQPPPLRPPGGRTLQRPRDLPGLLS